MNASRNTPRKRFAERTLDQRDLDILRFAREIADTDRDSREVDGVGSHDGRKQGRYHRLESVGLLEFDVIGEDDRARPVPIYSITPFGRLVLAQRISAWFGGSINRGRAMDGQ